MCFECQAKQQCVHKLLLLFVHRFLRYYYTNAAAPAPCNIAAFLYIKRLKSVCNFTTQNWRGLWIGAMMTARRVLDKRASCTLNLTSLLPGVTSQQLQVVESIVFQLLNGNVYISQSAYIQAHLNLRLLFKSVLYERQHITNRGLLHSHSEIVDTEKAKESQTSRSKSVDSAHSGERGALYVLS